MKTVKIENVNYVRTGYGSDDILKQEFVSAIFTYDDKGRVLEEKHFNPDNEHTDTFVNTYDGDLLVETSQYDENDYAIIKTLNVYNTEGQLVTKKNYYDEASVEEVFAYDYAGGLLKAEYLVDDTGNRQCCKEYFYENPKNNTLLTKEIEYDEDGNILYMYIYKYDDSGSLVEKEFDEVAAKDKRVFNYEYDGNGNLVKELTYNFDEILIAKKYCKYNEEGLILSEETEDLDNYKKIVYDYEGRNVVKISVLAKDESVVSWSELQYDAHNRLTASADYIIDEVDPSEYRLVAEAYRIYE